MAGILYQLAEMLIGEASTQMMALFTGGQSFVLA